MPHLFLGAIIISFSAVFVKFANVPATTSAFYRVFIGFVALFLFHLLTRRPMLKGSKPWLIMILCGFAFFGDLACWHRSIHYIGPGLATLLGNFQVIFLAGIAALVYKEDIGRRFIFSSTLALFGVGLITGLDWSGFSPEYKIGLALGLATALFYTVYTLSLQKTLTMPEITDPVAVMTAVCLTSSVFLFLSSRAENVSLAIPDLETGLSLFALGIVCQVFGWLFISRGLVTVKARYAGLILLLQPTLSFTWDVLFFHRPFGFQEALGAILALCGIYLGSVRPKAGSTKESKPQET